MYGVRRGRGEDVWRQVQVGSGGEGAHDLRSEVSRCVLPIPASAAMDVTEVLPVASNDSICPAKTSPSSLLPPSENSSCKNPLSRALPLPVSCERPRGLSSYLERELALGMTMRSLLMVMMMS